MRTTTQRDLDSGVTTVRVTGELLRATLATVRAAIGKAAAECPTAVLVDLSQVDTANASHLTVFVTATYEAQSHWGVPVLLYAAKPPVRTGMDIFRSFVAVYEDEWQARTALRAYVPRWMRQHLTPDPGNAAVARALAGEACLMWNLRELQSPARLIAAELAANAIRHAATDFDIMVAYTGRYLRIAVRDGSSQLPRAAGTPRPGAGSAPAGSVRGLCAVEAFSTHWGATRVRDGKIVWALISTDQRRD